MPGKQEIERIRFIHGCLDRAAAFEMGPCCIQSSGETHTYTADEVAAWPEIKRELTDLLENVRTAVFTVWDDMAFYSSTDDEGAHLHRFTFTNNYQRGLCMYRELLAPSPEAAPPAPKPGYCAKCGRSRALYGVVCEGCWERPQRELPSTRVAGAYSVPQLTSRDDALVGSIMEAADLRTGRRRQLLDTLRLEMDSSRSERLRMHPLQVRRKP